ncbi:MAG: carboxypeptidase regulatory-like domain-containing protein, partial [Zavarzinella sp.]|nr:carboxypeptidase regulatory-like domain-containing protein [Zavarzinella sp.]
RAVARRKAVEARARVASGAPADLPWREACAILHEELDRLPANYRSVLILCYLEGKSRDDAAAELGLTETVVKGALERGRKRLRARLRSRGVTLSAGLLAALREASATEVAPDLLRQVLRTTTDSPVRPVPVVGRVPVVKAALGVAVAAGLLLGLAHVVPPREASAEPPAKSPPPAEMKKETVARPKDAPKDGVLEVSGRVVGPDGKPAAGAKVFVAPRETRPVPGGRLEAAAVADADGRFRVTLNRKNQSYVVAAALGLGVDWTNAQEWKEVPDEVVLRLTKDVPITGRVVNTEGKPVPGVRVSPSSIYVPMDGDLDAYVAGWKRDWHDTAGTPDKRLYVPLDRLQAAVTTDKDGRFTVTGCGGDRIVHLRLTGAGIATDTPYVLTRPGLDAKVANAAAQASVPVELRIPGQPPLLSGPAVEYVAAPGKTVSGRVTDTDTGKPVRGARVGTIFGFGDSAEVVTDGDGTYRLEGLPRERGYSVFASLKDSDYLEGHGHVLDGPAATVTIDVKMSRGVVVTGRVTDKQTGKGVTAGIRVTALPDNKFFGTKPGYDAIRYDRTMKGTDANGRFRIVTIPGPAVVTAQVHSGEKLYGEVMCRYRRAVPDPDHKDRFRFDDGDWTFATADGIDFLSVENACKVVEVKEKGETTIELSVDRGRTATIRVEGPDGKPLAGVWAGGITEHWPTTFHLPEATTTVFALDPAKPRTLSFVHREKKLGGTATVRGDEKDPVVVRLAPLGSVTGTFTDLDGVPLAGATVGLNWPDRVRSDLYRELDRSAPTVKTDKDGKFRLDGIVPGVMFGLAVSKGDVTFVGEPRIGQRKVDAGQVRDLGVMKLKPVR